MRQASNRGNAALSALFIAALSLLACPASHGQEGWAHEAIADTNIDGIEAWRVKDTQSGARVDIYFDPISKQAAMAAIPLILETLNQNAEAYGVEPSGVEWFSIQLTSTNAAYKKLSAQSKGTWRIETDAKGKLTREGASILVLILPHEQAHALANATIFSKKIDPPLWFVEGQASWLGWRTGDRIPAFRTHVSKDREAHIKLLRFAARKIDLRRFSRGEPKPQALKRQMTKAQWEQYQRDGIMPNKAFVFDEGDIEQSENPPAHYMAASQVFEAIEKAAGLEGVQSLFRAIEKEPPGKLTTDRIIELCKATTGVDISGHFKN